MCHQMIYKNGSSWLLPADIYSSRVCVSCSWAPGSQVLPLISEVLKHLCAQWSLGIRCVWVRGCPLPTLGRSCEGAGKSTSDGHGLSSWRGDGNQRPFGTTQAFPLPFWKGGVTFVAPSTGSPLLRSYYFQLWDQSHNFPHNTQVTLYPKALILL